MTRLANVRCPFLGERQAARRDSQGQRVASGSCVRVLVDSLCAVGNAYGKPRCEGFFYELIIGHFHMWYIPMLAGLYVLTPLLRQIARSDEHARLFLALALVANFLLPWLSGTVSCFSGAAGSVLTKVVDGFRLDFVLGYGAYYVLGYRLNRSERQVPSALLVLMAAVSALVIVLGTWGILAYTGSFTELMYGNMTANMLACSVALFMLARDGRVAAERLMGNGLLSVLSRRSFGIYLVHPLVIGLLRDTLGLDWSTFGAAVGVPLVTLLTVAISLVLSVVLCKVPVIGRYVA